MVLTLSQTSQPSGPIILTRAADNLGQFQSIHRTTYLVHNFKSFKKYATIDSSLKELEFRYENLTIKNRLYCKSVLMC